MGSDEDDDVRLDEPWKNRYDMNLRTLLYYGGVCVCVTLAPPE